jgi:hypothetical protein
MFGASETMRRGVSVGAKIVPASSQTTRLARPTWSCPDVAEVADKAAATAKAMTMKGRMRVSLPLDYIITS